METLELEINKIRNRKKNIVKSRRDWRDSSVVKSPCSSSREPEFKSQHPHLMAHD